MTTAENNTASQAGDCDLRLCCKNDVHAPGCTTYDPARKRDEIAAQAGDEPMLPKPFGDIDIYEDSGRVRSVDGYTAEQMRAYRAAGQVSPRATADVELDSHRLEFMMERGAWIAWSKDGESCRLFHRTEDGESMPMVGWGARHWTHDPRQAIDAAIATTKPGA